MAYRLGEYFSILVLEPNLIWFVLERCNSGDFVKLFPRLCCQARIDDMQHLHANVQDAYSYEY